MVSLDIILQMQKQGMTDFEISKNLQSQGVSPREINEALNQAKIKGALNQTSTSGPINQPTQDALPPQPVISQPTLTSAPPTNPNPIASDPVITDPIIQQQPVQPVQESIMPAQPAQGSYPVQEAYPQDTYSGGGGEDDYYGDEYYDDGYADNESISEIAEQVVNEKFKEFTSRTGDLLTFKNSVEDHIRNLDERISRIENTIDKLQQSIIQKIGEFGENTTMIRRDLENLHNTTSKLMNPLIDNYRELEKNK